MLLGYGDCKISSSMIFNICRLARRFKSERTTSTDLWNKLLHSKCGAVNRNYNVHAPESDLITYWIVPITIKQR